MLMSCTPLPASKVNSDLHAACRQSKEVERVRRELELWRAETRLLGVSFLKAGDAKARQRHVIRLAAN